MAEVPTVRTPATATDVLSAIARALPSGAPDVAVRMIAAQSALETAGWQSMMNENAGNISVFPSSGKPWMHQGSPGSAAYAIYFESFNSLDDGVAAMVAWLSSHGVLPYAYAGDLSGYVAKLAAGNYFGNASPAAYEAAMASWMQKLASVPYTRTRGPWGPLLFVLGFGGAMVLGWWAIDTYVPGPRRQTAH